LPQLKWENNYQIIRAAIDKGDNSPTGAHEPFDLGDLQPKGWLAKVPPGLIRNFFLFWFWLGRETGWFLSFPIFWQAKCITRADDVQDVLSRNQIFNVPYGLEMEQLVVGGNCLLGDDYALHARQRALLLKVVDRADPEMLRRRSRWYAHDLIENSDGTLNIVADLITRVVTEVCAEYFGFKISDPDAFAQWNIAMSNWLFADPSGDPDDRALALNGAARLRAVIDEAIETARRANNGNRRTLIERLVNFEVTDGLAAPSNTEIRAMLLAMTVGQVPTITLAAGNIFEELRRRPGRWNQARAAAQNGDIDRLTAILFECARLNPALSPGVWRYVRQDTTVGKGWRRKKLTAGSVVMVSLLSALRDGYFFKHGDRFIIGRSTCGEPTDLIFGFDWHGCLGKHLAVAEISEIFAALLAQDDLKPAKGKAGTMVKAGPFARSFIMTFTPNKYREA
jgi:cytochrome P450